MRRTTIYSDSQRSRDENMVAFKKDKIGQALLTISYFLQTKGKNLTNIKIDDSKISEISRPWKDIHIFCLIVIVNKINRFASYIILRNNLLLHCIIDNPDFYISRLPFRKKFIIIFIIFWHKNTIYSKDEDCILRFISTNWMILLLCYCVRVYKYLKIYFLKNCLEK